MQITIAALWLALASPAVTSQVDTPPKQVASLCPVMAKPIDYSGQKVSVRGIVLGQDSKHLILVWPECQFGMHLLFTSESEGHADVKAFYRAVARGNPGTTDRDITREFVGIFHYSEVGPVYELSVESVRPAAPYGS